MPDVYRIKRGDTIPIKLRLKYSDGEVEDSLSSAISITFFMWPANAKFFPNLDDSAAVIGACTVEDEPNGVVQYAWAPGETDDAGSYAAEVEVVDAAGTRKTFPGDGYIPVHFLADLG